MFERKEAINKCLEKAYKEYVDAWNNECKSRGKIRGSTLPLEVANGLITEYDQMRKDCLKRYMIIPQ